MTKLSYLSEQPLRQVHFIDAINRLVNAKYNIVGIESISLCIALVKSYLQL